MEWYTLYYLCDPEDLICRYVGITKSPVNRVKQHVKEAKIRKAITHKNNWIFSLLQRGVAPKLEILEEGLTLEEARRLEVETIEYFRYLGFNLVNTSAGGDGPTGVVRTPEQRAHLRHLNTGKKHTEESKLKMSASRKGKRHSEAHCAAIARGHLGKKHPHTEETKAKIRANSPKVRKPLSVETKAKIAATLKARFQSQPDVNLVKRLWNEKGNGAPTG